MNKYYHQDIVKVEGDSVRPDQFFEDHATMIEFVREGWETYCRPIGDEWKLISLQDLNGRIIFTYEEVEFEDDLVTVAHRTEQQEWLDYTTVPMTWLISKLERMVANV